MRLRKCFCCDEPGVRKFLNENILEQPGVEDATVYLCVKCEHRILTDAAEMRKLVEQCKEKRKEVFPGGDKDAEKENSTPSR